MGLDLQPDGLTAELAGHCQPDKKHPQSQKEKESDLYVCFTKNKLTSSALMMSNLLLVKILVCTEKRKVCRQNSSLHQLRKRKLIGPKGREPLPPGK